MDGEHSITIVGEVRVMKPTSKFWYEIEAGGITFKLRGGYSLRSGDYVMITGRITDFMVSSIIVEVVTLKFIIVATTEAAQLAKGK